MIKSVSSALDVEGQSETLTQAQDVSPLPSTGERERMLTQAVQSLWYRHLAYRPQRVVCQLFSNSVAIIIEDSVTLPEQFLLANKKTATAQLARQAIHKFMQAQLMRLLEQVLERKVLVVLSDTALTERCTGITAILSEAPAVRNPSAIPKHTSKHKPLLTHLKVD